MLIDRVRYWLFRLFLWLALRCADIAAKLQPPPAPPPSRPALHLTPPGDGTDDAQRQQEFQWV